MSQFKFLRTRESEIIMTPMIEQTIARLLITHEPDGQFFVITGRSGAGKTSAGKFIRTSCNAAYDAGQANAFRACMYTSSDMRPVRPDVLERQLLVELATKALDLRVARDLRQVRVAMLQRMVLSAMQDRAIQLLVIDEAGMIPPMGLNALANLLNEAAMSGYPLTIALIGMNELPLNYDDLPQVERRVADTVWFEPADAETALAVLRHVHPYFETLDAESEEGRDALDLLLSPEATDGGMIGKMILLVQRAARHCKVVGTPFDAQAMRTAMLIKAIDAERAKEDARGGFRGQHPVVAENCEEEAASDGLVPVARKPKRSRPASGVVKTGRFRQTVGR